MYDHTPTIKNFKRRYCSVICLRNRLYSFFLSLLWAYRTHTLLFNLKCFHKYKNKYTLVTALSVLYWDFIGISSFFLPFEYYLRHRLWWQLKIKFSCSNRLPTVIWTRLENSDLYIKSFLTTILVILKCVPR